MSIKNKARSLYSMEEYEMAIPLYESLIALEPDSIRNYREIGNCYRWLKQHEKAIHYYRKCLRIDPSNADAFYNLGSSYFEILMYDSAIYFAHRLIDQNPQDTEALNLISMVFLESEDNADSAIFYAQKGIASDPGDSFSYVNLSMAYTSEKKYDLAQDAAQKGIEQDPSAMHLHLLSGIAYYATGEYILARQQFQTGWETPGFEELFADYYAKSIIIENTDPDLFSNMNERISFKNIRSENLDDIIAEAGKADSRYYYPTLLRKFRNNPYDMSLDDFILLYIGYSTDISYSPFTLETNSILELWDSEQYSEFEKEAYELCLKVPVHFPMYYYISEVNRLNHNYDQQLANLVAFYGFSMSILATGDGSNRENAIIIGFVEHELFTMSTLGFSVTDQELIRGKYTYDLLTGRSEDIEEVQKYFNISMHYSSMNDEFLKSKMNKKRRKKNIP